MNENTCAIIVLGMHRSGTSVLTKALSSIGIELGKNLLDATNENPKGYFENKEVVSTNDEILHELGCNWDSIESPIFQQNQEESFQEKISKTILKNYSHSKQWGIKDPRITKLHNLWPHTLDKLNIRQLYLLSNRHPVHVAKSLHTRDKTPFNQAMILWAQHQCNALEIVLENGGLVVDYDNIISNPNSELQRIYNFCSKNGLNVLENNSNFSNIFLDKNLNRSFIDVNEAKDYNNSPIFETCDGVYVTIKSLANSEGPMSDKEKLSARQMIKRARSALSNESIIKKSYDMDIREIKNEVKINEKEIKKIRKNLHPKDFIKYTFNNYIKWRFRH